MRIVLLCLTCFFQLILFAQPTPQGIRETIAQLESVGEVKYTYDHEVLELITISYPTNITPDQFKSITESNSALQIQQLADGYFSIVPSEATYSIYLSDSLSQQAIEQPIFAKDGIVLTSSFETDHWRISLQPKKDQVVSIHVLGFEDFVIPFAELLNSLTIRKQLKPKLLELADVTIEDYITKGINLNPADQSIKIKTADLPLLPGETDGDIFASLAALPGITTPDNRPGNLFIRGSSTDQSLVLFNNIPIYHRGHYYGTISPYNQKMVSEVKVYRNGFDPSIGGRVGGAIRIDTEYEPVNNQKIGLGANTLYGLGYLKIPSNDSRWAFGFGARRSFPYNWDSPKLEAVSDMVFSGTVLGDSIGGKEDVESLIFEDFSGGVSFRPNDRNHIQATGLYTRSFIRFSMINSTETNQLTNLGTNVSWDHQINSNLESHFSFTVSNYEFNYKSTARYVLGHPHSYNEINDIGLSQTFNKKLPRGNTILFGLNYAYQQVAFSYLNNASAQNTELVKNGSDEHSNTISAFVNYEWKNHPKFYMKIGSRVNYFSKLQDLKFAPRFFFNYYPVNALTIKSSSGLYYQYLSQIKVLEFINGGFDNELWQLANNKTAKIMHGAQHMIGAIYNRNKWIVDLEGYYKTTSNVSYYSEGRYNTNGYFYFADHKMMGADLLIKKQLNQSLTTWAGYSRSFLKIYVDTVAAISELSSQYSQPNVVNIGGSWQKNRWKIALGWKLASGQFSRTFRIISANLRSQKANGPDWQSSNANPFKDLPLRYADVHQLDISASYQIPKTTDRSWSGTFGISLLNVYNQINQTDVVVRSGHPEAILVPRYAMGFAPNLMVTFEW